MTQAGSRHSYTLRDYLDVEEVSVVRHELIDSEIGTEHYDRGEKREHYQRIEALSEYLLLSQDEPRIELWSRTSASGAWVHTVYGSGDVIDLRSIGCRLDVNGLYAAAGLSKSSST